MQQRWTSRTTNGRYSNPSSARCPASRRARATVAQQPGGPRWDLVDSADGAQWVDLPERYPPFQTCHRAFSVRDVLAAGLAANPPPQARRRPGQRGRLAQSPARNLLERLTLGQEQVLAFLDELRIPFDNNQSGRDLRGLKVQQKVSGCFPSKAEAEAFASLRGYLATLRKQGQALLAALETVFAGQPPLSCVRRRLLSWERVQALEVGCALEQRLVSRGTLTWALVLSVCPSGTPDAWNTSAST
jgi:Transposase IS66 family